jgi:ABC-type branched-subunit amino acid transport system permease subunit
MVSTGHQIILGSVLALMILFAPDGLLPLLRNALRRIQGGSRA